jgi:hypothetical protein
MGKKDRTFAAKIAKGAQQYGVKCATCGETYSMIKHVVSEKSETGSYKFREKVVGVCKCNQKEIYG